MVDKVCKYSDKNIKTTSNYEDFSKSSDIKGKNKCYSTNLIQQHKFGHPSLQQQYASERTMDQVLVGMIKSRFLSVNDFQNLIKTHPYYPVLGNMIFWAQDVDFSALK